MAAKTDWMLPQLSAILWILFINTVDAYYCDNDRCTEEEYCCGDNTCCPSYKVWDPWYFWCGVLFFMFLLTMCACLWRYRFFSPGSAVVNGYSYTALEELDVMGAYPDLKTSGKFERGKKKVFTSPAGTPPPYHQVSAGSQKVAAPPSLYGPVVGTRECY